MDSEEEMTGYRAIDRADRCPTMFERRGKGMRYVYARWQCPRKKMKGLEYCSYCEPYSKKLERWEAEKKARVIDTTTRPDDVLPPTT